MTQKHFHFSGICGTAMASVAVLMKNRGCKVTGSDENTYPPMSDFLAENGIEVQSPYHADNLKPHPDYVILGNALSRGNPEVEYALEAHLHYLSMAELLKNEFIRGNCSVVFSGTHGKTSTTSMAAHVFTHCGLQTGYMVGGIPENFGSSCADVEKGGYFIIEGDEYDTSLFDKRSKFFHYLPDRLVINNIEFDHADIFNNLDEIKRSFTLMLRQMPSNGLILVNGDDPHAMEVAQQGYCRYVSFGTGTDCDAVIRDCRPLKGKIGTQFRLIWEGRDYSIEIPLLGEFNARNAAAVMLLGLNEGVPFQNLQDAFLEYKSVKRRLQLVSGSSPIRVFDDFAHHPTAITETIGAVRQVWPDAKLHTIYEARSNTSVRRFHQEKMADAFKEADTVIFYKLHRGDSIAPEDRLDLNQVVQELRENGKTAQIIEDLEQITDHTIETSNPGDIVLIMSQGAFGGLPRMIAARLNS